MAGTLEPQLLLLALAGVGAGVTGSVVGIASLISYPALLAAGLPPVAANATNTVAVVASSIGSAVGSRPELQGQATLVRPLALAGGAGGLVGALLLLLTPPDVFARLVPWLIASASVAILLRPGAARAGAADTRDPRPLAVGVFLVAVYGGYFGAAAGVLMLALLLATTAEPLPRGNAVKNVVMGVVNGVAAVALAVLGPVSWTAAAPLAMGFLVGGMLGPALVRRLPVRPLRVLIAVSGLVLALRLGLDPT